MEAQATDSSAIAHRVYCAATPAIIANALIDQTKGPLSGKLVAADDGRHLAETGSTRFAFGSMPETCMISTCGNVEQAKCVRSRLELSEGFDER